MTREWVFLFGILAGSLTASGAVHLSYSPIPTWISVLAIVWGFVIALYVYFRNHKKRTTK